MKYYVFLVFLLIPVVSCKTDSYTTDTLLLDTSVPPVNMDTSNDKEEVILFKHKTKTASYSVDTLLNFISVKNIFEDEFCLIFENSSKQTIEFYYIAGMNPDLKYGLIIESEGRYIGNPKYENKKFRVIYTNVEQENFVGERKFINKILDLELIESKENEEFSDSLIIKLKKYTLFFNNYIRNINLKGQERNDSCAILYEEDFIFNHKKILTSEFVGINYCSGDSIFSTYYSDGTVQTDSTRPSIFWVGNFVLPTLNIRSGSHKEEILVKLGQSSYDMDSILIYPKYIPEKIVELEGGDGYDDTVFFIFESNRLIGIIATFHIIC